MKAPTLATALRRARLARRAGLPAGLVVGLFVLPLVAGADSADFPATPPFDGRIVYTRASSSVWDLYAADANGENEFQLTQTDDTKMARTVVGEDQPRWSPDGREIAFTTFRNSDGVASIWRVPFGGGTPMPMVTNDGTGDPAWSPDGSCLAFSGGRAGGTASYDLKAQCGDVVRTIVDTADLDERRPDWSPDGARLVYESARPVSSPSQSEDWGLRVVNADGTGDGPLIDWPGQSERLARWSPDGRTIAFISGQAAGWGTLCAIDIDSGAVSQLVYGAAGPLSWSPDSKQIVFSNILERGPEPRFAPSEGHDTPKQGELLMGLYMLKLEDRGLTRLHGPAGGIGQSQRGYEFGYSVDWSAGTATATPTEAPTLTPSPTLSPTPSPTATVPEATNTATATRQVSPTASATATRSGTEKPPRWQIFLPIGLRNAGL